MYRVIKSLILGLLGVVLTLFSTWGTLALFYQLPYAEFFNKVLILIFLLSSFLLLVSLFYRKYFLRALSFYGIVLSAFFLWYSTIKPSNDRAWQKDVVLLPYAVQNENLLTLFNIRNFTYRSEMDYDVHYYDKTFDLDKLSGVDVVAVYWMGPSVAHVFLSFEFDEEEHLAISIETRKEEGEVYSTLEGFFRKYELYYVVADERDVIALRTNYRKNPIEDVYIYPTSGTQEEAQELFLAYIEKINSLNDTPEFYNTLTTNCTTSIWKSTHSYLKDLSFSWKILVSGYVPEYLYDNNRLSTEGKSFEELKDAVHINERANRIETLENFSQRIREK